MSKVLLLLLFVCISLNVCSQGIPGDLNYGRRIVLDNSANITVDNTVKFITEDYTPLNDPNVKYWWHATNAGSGNITNSGSGTASHWYDMVTGANLIQATGSQQPTIVTNYITNATTGKSFDALLFNSASSQFMALASPIAITYPYSMLVVWLCNTTYTTNNYLFFAGVSGGGYPIVGLWAGNGGATYSYLSVYPDASHQYTTTSLTLPFTTVQITTYVIATAGKAWYMYNSTTQLATGTASDASGYIQDIGQRGNNSLYYQGYILDVVYFSISPSSTQLNFWVSYFKSLYGI